MGAKSKLAKQIDLKILDKTCPFKLLQSYGVKLDPLNLAHSFRLPLGKIQIEFFSIGGFSSQIRLLKNSNMQDRLFVRQFFFFEKMVKYHPWHYGKESSDKTFFHTGENYHYSFNFNYLSARLSDYNVSFVASLFDLCKKKEKKNLDSHQL